MSNHLWSNSSLFMPKSRKYQELQLNQAGSKKLISESNSTKGKCYHEGVFLFKIILTGAFCFLFVTAVSMIFGNENSVVGVAILLALLAFRKVNLGYDVKQSSYVMFGMFLVLMLGPHLANQVGMLWGALVNFLCMLLMTVFGCYEVRFFNHSTFLLSYLLLYGNDVTGDLYIKRVIALAIGGLWIALCLYRNHRHISHTDRLKDVISAVSVNASEIRWHIKVSLGVSLAMLLGQLAGLPRVMWIGIAAMSVIHPSDAIRRRSHMFYRFMGNVLGCVGFSATYRWQTIFNSFGALGLAMGIYGMNAAMLLRIVNNGFAVAFVFLYVPLFDKVMEIFTRQKVSKELLS